MDNTLCFHCSDLLPPGPAIISQVDGEPRHFCCLGCKAVSDTIINEGLEQFYQQRSAPTITPQPIDDATREGYALYDSDSLQGPLVHYRDDGALETQLMVEGLTCAACIWLIERHLERQPGVQSIRINHSTQRARVVWTAGEIALSQILLAIRELGFHASPFQPSDWEQQMQAAQKKALTRIGIAGLGSMQAMMLAYPLSFGLTTGTDDSLIQLFRWASWLIATPVVLYSAMPFLQAALRDLRVRHLTMDVPVSLAIFGGYIASAWITVAGGEEVYFESVCMFTFFLGLGRFLEMRGRYRAGLAGASLLNAMPQTARLQLGDTERLVPAQTLKPGDTINLRPGDSVPADGTIIAGSSALDESMLTGEYLPVTRSSGERVCAGTVNSESPLQIRVDQAGQHTRLSAIMRILDQAQQEKPRTAIMADQVARYFVAAVLLAATITFATWLLLEPSRAFAITLAVLVVTCPCALSLATPTALTAATSALRAQGFLPTRGTTLEGLSTIDTLVFDKTGTLTEGRLSLRGLTPLGDMARAQCLALAAGLERHSEHPVAHAFRELESAPLTEVRNQPGQGITGQMEGRRYAIGSAAFVADRCQLGDPDPEPDDGSLTIYLATEGQWLARLALDDHLRPDALSTLRTLKQRGYQLIMASGDQSPHVARVAGQLPLDQSYSGQSPEDKLALVKALEARGHQVMMIGDGLNDLPVLAGARLSVAVAGASDIARLKADAMLLGETLTPLVTALTLAPRTRRVIRQNITLSLLYNATTLPLAMMGLIPPWLAAIGMSASSVVVVLNALRLGRTRVSAPVATAPRYSTEPLSLSEPGL
ncbi:MAG: heavy metal translocating P-type ATPase [Halomonadaceae bacterium]|nr:MAG: heavy metal translocating P-type ATPase [Halomonadaceae bacterium]